MPESTWGDKKTHQSCHVAMAEAAQIDRAVFGQRVSGQVAFAASVLNYYYNVSLDISSSASPQMSDGYFVRQQDGDLKYMVVFHKPEVCVCVCVCVSHDFVYVC
jgi:hypothetical protein